MDKIAVVWALAALVATSLALSEVRNAGPASREITAAVQDPSRPSSDTGRDSNRKPAESLAFAQVKPGDKVADYAAGSGYFTRLFSKVVEPDGHVYAVWRPSTWRCSRP